MSSALSVDLRQRVVHAVAAGASRHKAAERFGVSLASASRWCERFAREGHVAPKPMGGDLRSHQIEAQADLIVSRCAHAEAAWVEELAEHGLAREFLGRVHVEIDDEARVALGQQAGRSIRAR